MPEQVCGNCQFHVLANREGYPVRHECWRNPPVALVNNTGAVTGSAFPSVSTNGWCGEWKSTTSPGARKPDPLPNGFREIESKLTDQKPVFLPEKESDGSQDATSDQH